MKKKMVNILLEKGKRDNGLICQKETLLLCHRGILSALCKKNKRRARQAVHMGGKKREIEVTCLTERKGQTFTVHQCGGSWERMLA